MKHATTIITTFLLSIAQFIIGVMILADKANLKTIGWYYVFSSSFMVLMAILSAVAIAIKNGEKP